MKNQEREEEGWGGIEGWGGRGREGREGCRGMERDGGMGRERYLTEGQAVRWKADKSRIENLLLASFGSPPRARSSEKNIMSTVPTVSSFSFSAMAAQTSTLQIWWLNFAEKDGACGVENSASGFSFSCSPFKGAEIVLPPRGPPPSPSSPAPAGSPLPPSSMTTVWSLAGLSPSPSIWVLLLGDSFGNLFLFLYEEGEREEGGEAESGEVEGGGGMVEGGGKLEFFLPRYKTKHVQTIKCVHGKQRTSSIFVHQGQEEEGRGEGDVGKEGGREEGEVGEKEGERREEREDGPGSSEKKMARSIFSKTIITGGRNGRICEFQFSVNEAGPGKETEGGTARNFLESLYLVKTHDAKGYKNMDIIENIFFSPLHP
jgi:hypothetical protein